MIVDYNTSIAQIVNSKETNQKKNEKSFGKL